MKERKWKNLDQAGSQPDYQENNTFEFTCRDKNKDISHIRDQQKDKILVQQHQVSFKHGYLMWIKRTYVSPVGMLTTEFRAEIVLNQLVG